MVQKSDKLAAGPGAASDRAGGPMAKATPAPTEGENEDTEIDQSKIETLRKTPFSSKVKMARTE
jgi:hypothetical protein